MEEEWMRPTRGSISFPQAQGEESSSGWKSTLGAASRNRNIEPGLPTTETMPRFTEPVLDRDPVAHNEDRRTGLHHVFLGSRPLSNNDLPALSRTSQNNIGGETPAKTIVGCGTGEVNASVDAGHDWYEQDIEGLKYTKRLESLGSADALETDGSSTSIVDEPSKTLDVDPDGTSNGEIHSAIETTSGSRQPSADMAPVTPSSISMEDVTSDQMMDDEHSVMQDPIIRAEEVEHDTQRQQQQQQRFEWSVATTDADTNHPTSTGQGTYAAVITRMPALEVVEIDEGLTTRSQNFSSDHGSSSNIQASDEPLHDIFQPQRNSAIEENLPASTKLPQSMESRAVSEEQPEISETWAALMQDTTEPEDDWEKTLESKPAVSGDLWNALVDDDDDGFLEDEDDDLLTNYTPLPQVTPSTSRPASSHSVAHLRPSSSSINYHPLLPAAPVQANLPSAKPSEFFAELPSTRIVRSKKPPPASLSTGPPPPPQSRTASVPIGQSSRSATVMAPPPTRLQAPAPLELFPPQSGVPLATSTTIPNSPMTHAMMSEVSLGSNFATSQMAAPNRYSKPPTPINNAPRTEAATSSSYISMESQPYPQTTRHVLAAPRQNTYQSQSLEAPNQPNMVEAQHPVAQQIPSRYAPQHQGTIQSQATATAVSSAAQSRQASLPAAFASQPPKRFAPRTSSPLAQPDTRPHLDRSVTAPVPRQLPQSDIVGHGPPYAFAARPVPMKEVRESSDALQRMPIRPRTQSPELVRAHTGYTQNMPGNAPRPASTVVLGTVSVHEPEPDNTRFVPPQDETIQDSLCRWRGSPLLRVGGTGSVLTMFPIRQPRYVGGQAAPMLSCVAGQPKVRKAQDIMQRDNDFTTFPGPLKAKNRKKDVMTWLETKISRLRHEILSDSMSINDEIASQLCRQEKVVLWQTTRLLVEHDGIIAGNQKLATAIAGILLEDLPSVHPDIGVATSRDTRKTTIALDDAVDIDPQAMSTIKKKLLDGQSESAVWYAADHRLWAHAMLIASALPGDTWKKVAQDFVRNEVRQGRPENKSIAALYEVLAGNSEESVDQLVPPSARAGLQLVNTKHLEESGEDTQGSLNTWRETLALILQNRSKDDGKAISALGRLLASYGRVEAAHVCFLLARSTALFGGADDAQSAFTLLGARNVTTSGVSFDMDSILLSEVYEFALSLAPTTSSSYYIPHLQSYKLQHAFALLEAGQRKDAINYGEAIGLAMKASTRASLYYHSILAFQLDDLMKRTSQVPKDATSAWISKPSIEKVSGSMWAKFNSFVAGDDAPGSSTNNVTRDTDGPFARLTGGTPTISRSASTVDLRTNMDLNRMPSYGASTSRYAPASYGGTQSSGIQDPTHPTFASYGSTTSLPAVMDGEAANHSTNYGMPGAPQPSSLSSSPSSRYPFEMSIPQPLSNQYPQTMASNYYPSNVQYSSQYAPNSQGQNPTGMQRPEAYGLGLGPASDFGSTSNHNNSSAVQNFHVTPLSAPDVDVGHQAGFRNNALTYTQPQSYTPNIASTPAAADQVPQSQFADGLQSSEVQAPVSMESQVYDPHGTSSNEHLDTNYGYTPYSIGAERQDNESHFATNTGESVDNSEGYAPPSYQPTYQPYETEVSATDGDMAADLPRSKKQSFMDDDEDEDLARRAAELKLESKARNDASANDNVRKAAEADGKSLHLFNSRLC